MTDLAALEAERADLQRKLAAREGQPAYAESVVLIIERLAAIEEEIGTGAN
jgi:hypothetical protein